MASPLTTAQQVRLRIQDPWRLAEEVRFGDGTASEFKLAQGAPFSNLSALSAYTFLLPPTGWSATGATVDLALGLVQFSGVITAQTAWRAKYQWAVFSDDELGHFTAVGGGVPGAALEAVRALLFDGLRRAKWAAPDGTEYDDTNAQKHLREIEKSLLDEIERSDGPQGGIDSWSEQQGYFSSEYNG